MWRNCHDFSGMCDTDWVFSLPVYHGKGRMMKQPKRLSRVQKECLSAHHLVADNWALVEETEFYLKVINKETGARKTLDKFRREKRR